MKLNKCMEGSMGFHHTIHFFTFEVFHNKNKVMYDRRKSLQGDTGNIS